MTRHIAPFALLLLAATASASAGDHGASVRGEIAKGNNFSISADTLGDCKANAECKVQIKLLALSDFHVNKEYPYKFKAADVAGIEWMGTDAAGKNVFSKAAGDFVLDASNEKVGYMNLKFKPSKAGAINLPGTFKMSVCSAQNCQLETQELQVPVTVK